MMTFVDAVPTAAQIQACVAIDAKVQITPWSLAKFESSFAQDCFLLLCEGQAVLAYCIWREVLDEAELLTIAVHPDYQGQGLAKKLFTEMLKRCSQKGIQRMFLEVVVSNAPALALYHSLGFIEQGVRKNYYHTAKGALDAKVLRLELNA
ncbi:MAG: ribosomal-protein-alanine N-acetyltransferase [Gammaproteobacteria bacterium CG11_big_fil_rev_8_21_14_0_20_46_22]|nr:MAG: ribosomal-protein-alanine N-acetyltransferase [Gammaproteobacteria bacterium CG12_big_fil_rev_8_21_14_0_65_46_12]PIR12002.1 MAG: ribosomal-protein-alanine N-acetyltransferase [Gammaproteobacteria bacterium CG11_big_fil_rev_8_21_14_0_20_46_22]